jgi:hypothetical protein
MELVFLSLFGMVANLIRIGSIMTKIKKMLFQKTNGRSGPEL